MNGTVLVVSSNVSALWDLSDMLELEGYDVLRTSSGSQAIALARQHQPNLILCTPDLGDTTPEEIVQQLRDPVTKGIPLLVIVYNAGQSAYRHYTSALLSIPFTPKELLEAVDHTIRKDESYWVERSKPAASLPPKAPAVNLSGRSILLLTGNSGMQVLIKISLERGGARVVGAKDQEMLGNLLEVETVDLIILDVDAHDPNATRLVKHIRNHPSTSSTPILVFVPRGFADVVIECIQAGATDYLPKPILAYDLLRKVDAMLKPS